MICLRILVPHRSLGISGQHVEIFEALQEYASPSLTFHPAGHMKEYLQTVMSITYCSIWTSSYLWLEQGNTITPAAHSAKMWTQALIRCNIILMESGYDSLCRNLCMIELLEVISSDPGLVLSVYLCTRRHKKGVWLTSTTSANTFEGKKSSGNASEKTRRGNSHPQNHFFTDVVFLIASTI